MNSLRITAVDQSTHGGPCCRCGTGERRWDRIAGKPYCPNCQESLAQGEGPPLIEPTEKNACAICSEAGTVRYLTFPLHASSAVEIDLCPEHLRGLLGRRLGPYAFHQLRRRLLVHGIDVEEVFLLHAAFYDRHGRALHPAVEVE